MRYLHFLVFLALIGVMFAAPGITLKIPSNNSITDSLPTFVYYVNESATCDLNLMNSSAVNYETTNVVANKDTLIFLNSTIYNGFYTWNANCTSSGGTANSSVWNFEANSPIDGLVNLSAIILPMLAAFLFGYLSLNLGKQHSGLSVFFLMLSIIFVVVAFFVGYNAIRIAEGTATWRNVVSVFESVLLFAPWIFGFIMIYFFILLIPLIFNVLITKKTEKYEKED